MSMSEVKVNVENTLKKVKENRELHNREHQEALAAHKETLKGYFREQLEDLAECEKDEDFEPERPPQMPEHHLDEYDRYIQMLEWSTDNEVVLTEDQFACIIMDNWRWQTGWKQAIYTMSNNRYRGQ